MASRNAINGLLFFRGQFQLFNQWISFREQGIIDLVGLAVWAAACRHCTY